MAELPDWKPLAGVAPPSSDGAGRIVGVVASEAATASGWGPSAALDLARSWSAAGRRVMLVDGALQFPSLHDAAGVANREGLTDAALHGASVARVSHPIDEGDFFLVTAGTPVADTSSVVRSGRWHRLAEGITEAGAILMLYLRDGDAGTSAFLGSASDIVVLATPGDRPPLCVRDLTPLVRAVTGSDRSADTVAAAPDSVGTTPGPATPRTDAEGGLGRLFLMLLVVLIVAAGLGFLLTSLL